MERIHYKKNSSVQGKKQFIKLKGQRRQSEISVHQISSPNAKLGFKCMHYSVTESSGFVEIIIVKKVSEDMVFWVQTRDGTASAPEDYEQLE